MDIKYGSTHHSMTQNNKFPKHEEPLKKMFLIVLPQHKNKVLCLGTRWLCDFGLLGDSVIPSFIWKCSTKNKIKCGTKYRNRDKDRIGIMVWT